MFKKLVNKKRLNNEKGLTLIELLAVIVILAIIAAIAIPAIGNIIENTRYNAVKADAINVLNAANLYFTDEPDKTEVTVKTLLDEKYLDTAGKIPEGNTNKVTKEKFNTLTTSAIVYTNSKTVTFDGATIDSINGDKQKGSKESNKTIPSAPSSSGTSN
ncbi:prepilin-type N-terminal cleavage/methylation domain-containing protein [Lysinibacillus xylanilyticus]|uniref:prepilin-type N-terminal cleavage/methylation domain-containing protein n=1 Tax=Lysinibacillus xylanilyticus TaxID=582475 RepID=UPI00380D7211